MAWISAAIGVGGALLGGSSKAKAEKKAAQQAAAQYETGVKRVEQNTGLQQMAQGGTAAYNQALGLLGVGGAPQQAPQIDLATGQPMAQAGGQGAFQNYLDSTGYRTQMKSGIDALNSNAAARGMLKSGATLKATQRFGAGLGQQYFSNYINQLMAGSNQGLAANQTMANVYTGAASGTAGAMERGTSSAGETVGSAIGDAAKNVVGAFNLGQQPAGTQAVK